MQDHLLKAIAGNVRIYAAVTTNLVQEAIEHHRCRHVAGAALGRTMTGALLLAANMKNDEALTVQFDGHGPLGKVIADASPNGYVRGFVGNSEVLLPLNEKGKIDVGGGVGQDGLLTITRFTGMRNPIAGSIAITSGEIAEDITQYLYQSEQTPSSVALGVLIDPDYRCIGAGGFMVQPLPEATESDIERLEKNLKNLRPVSAMVHDGLSAKDIIQEVLDGFAIAFLEESPLKFQCQCSKKRIREVLSSLRPEDLDLLIEDGSAEVSCHFCNTAYRFTKEELEEIRSGY